MRVILYTGKGGVGKTSVAAASAVKMSKEGKRVLVMSTDPAHSLGDSFDRKLGRNPIKIRDNLDAIEIDTVYESEQVWAHMKDYMKEMLTARGEGGIETEELLVFPGMEELFSLFKILDIYEEGNYDVLVVDCAPTGETLSLLKYPEMFSDFIEKVLPMKRKGVKMAGPIVEKLVKIPMPDDSVFDDFERVMAKMKRLQELMLNKEIVSLRIVTTPEKIVIKEAKRNFTCLHLYNYNVDAIIVNRIYPKAAMEGYFNKWFEMQEQGLNEIEESFSEVPRFYLNLQKKEIRTVEVLEQAGIELFGEKDISKVLFQKKIIHIEHDGDVLVMKIYLPYAVKEELDLRQNGEELILSVKNERRCFLVPREFIGRDIQSAKLEAGYLKIGFE